MSQTPIQQPSNERKERKSASSAASERKGTVSNVYKLDPQTPIPIGYNSSIFSSINGKMYMPFLNPKDTFFQLLTEAAALSPTTTSCISSKAKYCVGKGWFLKDKKEDKLLTDWAKSVNRKGDSLNDILFKGFYGKFNTGNKFIEVVRGKVGGKPFVKVYARPTMECRLSLADEYDICNSVYLSKLFLQRSVWNLKSTQVIEIPLYSPNSLDNSWVKDELGFEHTMFHLKNETELNEYYGMPSNIGSLLEQIIEYKHARHNLDDLDNNMVIGGMITIKSPMTTDEARALAKNVITTHTGDGKVGRWIVNSSESGIPDGVQVEQFDTQRDGSFVEADIHNESKIYTSNQWNKVLVGGTEAKGIGGGNSSYIRSVFDIANNTVIMPEQEYIIEKFLKPLLRICDEWMHTNWSGYEIGLKATMPITFLGDIDVNSIITVNEAREMVGKSPLEGEEGNKIIGKTSPTPPKDGLQNDQKVN